MLVFPLLVLAFAYGSVDADMRDQICPQMGFGRRTASHSIPEAVATNAVQHYVEAGVVVEDWQRLLAYEPAAQEERRYVSWVRHGPFGGEVDPFPGMPREADPARAKQEIVDDASELRRYLSKEAAGGGRCRWVTGSHGGI